jgi:hypothetical protein
MSVTGGCECGYKGRPPGYKLPPCRPHCVGDEAAQKTWLVYRSPGEPPANFASKAASRFSKALICASFSVRSSRRASTASATQAMGLSTIGFATTEIETKSGEVLNGRIEREDGRTVVIRPLAASEEGITVRKTEIRNTPLSHRRRYQLPQQNRRRAQFRRLCPLLKGRRGGFRRRRSDRAGLPRGP